MEEEENLAGDIEVPESVLLKRLRPNKYGSVPGLDDSELADPDELERQVLRQEFAPVLALPVKAGRSCIRPNIDEGGRVDWGAFGTVDFDRYSGGFDKARYKADKVREQLKDLLIMFSIVSDRIKAKAKYLVLKYLRMGIIELEHIVDNDMLALARLYLRAERMRKEIAELQEAGERRRQRIAALWASS
jgi:hypothetical protein